MATSKTRKINLSKLPPRMKIPEEQIDALLGDKPATDADTLKDLILWARKERINLSHVTVGTIAIVMVDNAAYAALAQPRETAPDKPGGIYAQYGAAVLGTPEAPTPTGGIEPTVEDDDD